MFEIKVVRESNWCKDGRNPSETLLLISVFGL